MKDYEVTPPPDRLADRVQLRTAFSTERGEVTRFMIQLEYWLEGDWRGVVRYDHDRDAPGERRLRRWRRPNTNAQTKAGIWSLRSRSTTPSSSACSSRNSDGKRLVRRRIRRVEEACLDTLLPPHSSRKEGSISYRCIAVP